MAGCVHGGCGGFSDTEPTGLLCDGAEHGPQVFKHPSSTVTDLALSLGLVGWQ